MKIKINETYGTPTGIKQKEIIIENILTISEIDNNLHILTKNGETSTVLNIANPSISKIEILCD